MHRCLLILLLLCAPLSAALAQGARAVASAETVEAVQAVQAVEAVEAVQAVAWAGSAAVDAATRAGGMDADPCHAHNLVLPPPGPVVHAGRAAVPHTRVWRPSDGHHARPERPDWPAARHGVTQLSA